MINMNALSSLGPDNPLLAWSFLFVCHFSPRAAFKPHACVLRYCCDHHHHHHHHHHRQLLHLQ